MSVFSGKNVNKMGSGGFPHPKLTKSEIPAALAAHDRAQAASDEIRGRLELPPVPESNHVATWRAQIAAKPKKRRSVKRSKTPKKVPASDPSSKLLKAAQARIAELEAELEEFSANVEVILGAAA